MQHRKLLAEQPLIELFSNIFGSFRFSYACISVEKHNAWFIKTSLCNIIQRSNNLPLSNGLSYNCIWELLFDFSEHIHIQNFVVLSLYGMFRR